MTSSKRLLPFAVLLLTAPLLVGAEGEGCDSPAFSSDPAPDMSGSWAIDYADDLRVRIELGGAVYDETVGAAGGVVTIDHDGQPFMFDLACDREEVVCPSEVWPTTVSVRQDDTMFPHRVWLQVAQQECPGMLVTPAPDSCGAGTLNPDCEQVCDMELRTVQREAFGTIDNPGEKFTFLLGAGIATNGVNCVLLGGSIAQGDLATSGSADTGDWTVDWVGGDVITEYAGGCLWAGDPDDDGSLEAIVVGAKVRFETGFDGMRN